MSDINGLAASLRTLIETRDRDTNLLEGLAGILSDAQDAESALGVTERVRALALGEDGGQLQAAPNPQVAHQRQSPWPVNGAFGQSPEPVQYASLAQQNGTPVEGAYVGPNPLRQAMQRANQSVPIQPGPGYYSRVK